ncbi:RecQ type DNA helicase Tlh1 [Schizosaccharomyces japonicus yFS275]|nr:RecQ type DNA helicase Tlh1 [Schizosaccharomyces japonicus yFS275]EQC53000.1 RecQ type DNA helicase Tlh1 [Schizosaccharomyces japonicus yFS275]
MHLLSECWRKYKFDENLQERIVIFCRKKETVQEMNAFLNGSSFITTMSTLYTGDLTEEERSTNMQAFSNEESETRIMVATKAFGMGMDYASIRLVIHLHSPETMLDYVQESGRAGRDGKKSEAVLLFDQSDLKSKFVSEEMKRMIQDDSACLRTPVSLEMDGEYSCCLILPKAEPCSRCSTLMPADNCQNKTVPAETQKDANPRSVGIECYEASRMTS